MNMFPFILVHFRFYEESNIISSWCQDSGLATEAEHTKATNQMLSVALLRVVVLCVFFPSCTVFERGYKLRIKVAISK